MTDQISALDERRAIWAHAERLQERLLGPRVATLFVLALVLIVGTLVVAPSVGGLTGWTPVGLVVVGLAYVGWRTAVWPRTIAQLARLAVGDGRRPLLPEEAAGLSPYRLDPQDARTVAELDRILALDEPLVRTPSERRTAISALVITVLCLLAVLAGSVLLLLGIFAPTGGDDDRGFVGLLLMGVGGIELGLNSATVDLTRIERARAVAHAQWLLDAGAVVDDGTPTTVIVRVAGRLIVDPALLRPQIRPRAQHFRRIPGTLPPLAIVDLCLAWALLGFALLLSLVTVATETAAL